MSNQELPSPFHAGELLMQDKVGARERVHSYAPQFIRDHMPQQHREFFQQLPFLVMGSIDNNGDTWASIIAGKPGFIGSPTEKALSLPKAALEQLQLSGDPLLKALKTAGADVGLLGIELATRRRNRMNANVSHHGDRIHLDVQQSFGNCPKYIQTRELYFSREPNTKAAGQHTHRFTRFDREAIDLIANTHTFFVSSYVHRSHVAPQTSAAEQTTKGVERYGVDVSHRGGMAGFIKLDGNQLTIPDFSGNNHFNTLGNFLLNPKAGICIPNFDTGDVLQMTGSVELLDPNHPEVQAFVGAERAWRFTLSKGQWQKKALPFTARFQDYSPYSTINGSWAEVQQILEAEADHKTASGWMPLRLVRKQHESDQICSFYFEHARGKHLIPPKAGQHISLRLTIPTKGEKTKQTIRSYTLTSAADERHYRISVKREAQGLVSTYLHEKLNIGDQVDAKPPAGKFTLNSESTRHPVFIGAGVGITPTVAMAKTYAKYAKTSGLQPAFTIIHAAKNQYEQAFYTELQALAGGRYISLYSAPNENTRLNANHVHGRLNTARLRQLLALDDYDFYLCGPAGFMQSTYDALRKLGVADQRIQAEAFGPSALNRADETDQNTASQATVNTYRPPETLAKAAQQAQVTFSKSGITQTWQTEDGNLLAFAEAQGLAPDFGCRSGNCGACAVKIKSGSLSYNTEPDAPLNENEGLLCCAVPAEGSEILTLEL